MGVDGWVGSGGGKRFAGGMGGFGSALGRGL